MADVKIFAYYYPWYRGQDSRSFVSWYRHYPPLLGFYRSEDPAVINQHLRWSVEYGIDGFLVEWAGTEGGDPILWDTNLGIMRGIMPDYPDFRYAVFYDQRIRFGGLEFGGSEKREAFLQDIEKIAADNFDHPNCWRIGDRPVIVIYLTRSCSEGYGALLDEARERAARASGYFPFFIGDEIYWSNRIDNVQYLDAITSFNMHNNERLIEYGGDIRTFNEKVAEQYDVLQRRARREDVGFIPGINVGYNDEAVRSGLPFLPTWEPGSMPDYRGDMVHAIETFAGIYRRKNPIPQMYGIAPMFINSFNEWPERSTVEPSVEIEALNDLNFFETDRRLLLPGHGFRFLEGIRAGKARISADLENL